MANSTPESEFDLKKRLIGAFILIGFGVVVLPALLGGEDPQLDPDQAHPTPSLESKVFVSKITPIGGATPKLTTNPMESIQTMTAYIVQVSLGDTPAGGVEYLTCFSVAALLFVMTLVLNLIANVYLFKKTRIYS